jgi:hypothetical protein
MPAERAKQEPRDPTADNPGAAARIGMEAKASADLIVRISGLHLSGNRPVSDLVAYPGDRVGRVAGQFGTRYSPPKVRFADAKSEKVSHNDNVVPVPG